MDVHGALQDSSPEVLVLCEGQGTELLDHSIHNMFCQGAATLEKCLPDQEMGYFLSDKQPCFQIHQIYQRHQEMWNSPCIMGSPWEYPAHLLTSVVMQLQKSLWHCVCMGYSTLYQYSTDGHCGHGCKCENCSHIQHKWRAHIALEIRPSSSKMGVGALTDGNRQTDRGRHLPAWETQKLPQM